MPTPFRMCAGLLLLIATMTLAGCQAPAAAPAAADVTAPSTVAAPAAEDVACQTPALSLLGVEGSADESGYTFTTHAHAFDTLLPWSSSSFTQIDAGIDDNVVTLVSAHGSPQDVILNGVSVALPFGNAPLGNCATGQDGKLRYLILDSCNVMAHGPICGDDYSCPGQPLSAMPGGNDMNVYARWGKSLGNNLRMVCGPSTLIEPANINKVVERYQDSQHFISVADSVLGGLSQSAVALCLTLGGEKMNTIPLVTDKEITAEGNTAGETYYYLQYYKPSGSDFFTDVLHIPASALANSALFPTCMPPLVTDKLTVESKQLGEQALDFAPPTTENEALSRTMGDRDYVDTANGVMKENEYGFRYSVPEAYREGRMMLAQTPVDGSAPQLVTQKNVQVVFTPQFDLVDDVQALTDKLPPDQLAKYASQLQDFLRKSEIATGEGRPAIPFLDEQQRVEVWLNNDGTPIAIIRRYQPITDVFDLEALIPPDEAYARAQQQLGDKPELYRLASWTFGYANGPDVGDSGVPQMHLWYQFHFAPDPEMGVSTDNFSPRDIWIPGTLGESCPD